MTSPNPKENVKTSDKVAPDTSEKVTGTNLAVIGGLGVVGGLGGVSVSAPVTVAGAVVCVAAYGAKKAIQERDCCALISVAGGAFTGAGISAVLSGMSLALAETAVGVSMAPVVAAGAAIGLAGYGLTRLVQRAMKLQAPNCVGLKNTIVLPLRSKL